MNKKKKLYSIERKAQEFRKELDIDEELTQISITEGAATNAKKIKETAKKAQKQMTAETSPW